MVRTTSLTTYIEITESGLLSKKRQRVYEIIYKFGPMTGGEVAQTYGPIYHDASKFSESIRNRITELWQRKVVANIGTRKCSVTGRNSIVWQTTDSLPKDVEIPETKKEKIKRLENRIEQLEKQIVILNWTNL